MANIFLNSNETFTLSDGTNNRVFGAGGDERVVINDNAGPVNLDQNIEQVQLSGASSDYTFQQTGTSINVFRNGTLIAKTPLQTDNDGTLLTFSNGTFSAKLELNPGSPPAISLGGTTIPSNAPGPVTPGDNNGGNPGGENTAPVFNQATQTASVAEGGTTVGTFAATDTAGDTLTYSLSGADAALFNVNTSTGAITFKTAPDFEAPADQGADNAYQITLTATDQGQLTATTAITVNVTDVNEAAKTLVVGQTQNSTVATGQKDSFVADLVAGQRYIIDVDGSNGLDSFLFMRATNGNQSLLSANNNVFYPTSPTTDSQLDIIPTFSGLHTFEVLGFNNTGGDFSISLTQSGTPEAQNANNDISKFNIDYVLTDAAKNFSIDIEPAVQQAIARLEQIIVGDRPSFTDETVGFIDDFRMSVDVKAVDGESNTLAFAGPDAFFTSERLPHKGSMTIDEADVQGMIDDGSFVGTIIHEAMHALGFGTLWEDHSFATATEYKELAALEQYSLLKGSDQVSIPLHTEGGEGSAGSHWEDSLFPSEIMAASQSPGEANLFSAMSAAAMADLGYIVNLSAADAYSLS